MVDGDGGINIEVQPTITVGGSTGGPGLLAGMRTRRPDPRQVNSVDTLIDQPP